MSTIENLDEINFEKKITKNGYGNFPYLLFKSSPATFTQIPIHFNIPDDCKNVLEHILTEFRRNNLNYTRMKIILNYTKF